VARGAYRTRNRKILRKGELVAQYAAKPQKVVAAQRAMEEFIAPEYGGDLEPGIDVVAKARSLWNQRRLISRIALASLLAATALAFLLPKRYDAVTKLMPPDNQSSSGLAMIAALASKSNSAPGLSSVAGDLLGVKSSGALFIGILISETVQNRIIDRFDLQKVYELRYRQDVRNKLRENSAFDEDRKSGIISLSVSDRDPRRAAAIAAAYVEELNKLVAELSTSAARKERVFLEERLVTVKRDLDQASRDFSQFSSKNKTLDIKEEARAMLQGAASLEGELIALQSQLRGLQAIYSDNNVRVRSVQARISELQRQLNNIGGAASGATAAQADSMQSQFPTIRNLPLLGVTYADLYRHMQIQEAVYEALTQQFELAKVQEAKEIPSVKILDMPAVPERKSYPPRLLIIVLGGLLGLLGACIFVFGRANWAEIDPAEPGKILVTEMLHAVSAKMPWAPPNGSRLQAKANQVWVKLASKKASGSARI
jgi:capsule polysaccharide export protein KpsE/RkpR